MTILSMVVTDKVLSDSLLCSRNSRETSEVLRRSW